MKKIIDNALYWFIAQMIIAQLGTRISYKFLEKDNKYLMLHRTKKENDINKNKWLGVGGKLEKDEDWISGLKREVMEETGCSVDVLPIYYSDVDVQNNFIVRTYI